MANSRTARTKLLVTVALLFLASAGLLGLYAYAKGKDEIVYLTDRDSYEFSIRDHRFACDTDPTSRQNCDEIAPAFEELGKPENLFWQIITQTGRDKRKVIDWRNFLRLLAIAAGLASTAAIAVLVWTKPRHEGNATSMEATNFDQARSPLVATSQQSDPKATLEQLKALHSDGLITDADYDRKRQAILDGL